MKSHQPAIIPLNFPNLLSRSESSSTSYPHPAQPQGPFRNPCAWHSAVTNLCLIFSIPFLSTSLLSFCEQKKYVAGDERQIRLSLPPSRTNRTMGICRLMPIIPLLSFSVTLSPGFLISTYLLIIVLCALPSILLGFIGY